MCHHRDGDSDAVRAEVERPLTADQKSIDVELPAPYEIARRKRTTRRFRRRRSDGD